MATDDDWERGGLTRTDVLRARAYPESIVAGNGHTPEPVTGITTPAGIDTRRCARCGKDMTGKRPLAKYCGRSCQRAAARDRRPARQARETGSKDEPVSDRSDPSVAPGQEPLVRTAGADFDRLALVVRTLTGAGLTVSLQVGGLELNVRS